MALVLGIETTCDETAAAVVEDGRMVRSSVVASQVDLHAKYGGVVPEIAARAHIESLNAVVAEALHTAGVRGPELDAIAVANTPGLIGCLLVGVSAAKGFAFAWDKPLVAVNHVQAHLYSVVLENEARRHEGTKALRDEETTAPTSLSASVPQCLRASPELPAIGLVISGGHSALYRVAAFDDITRIGTTHDDAVGEAFDKVAAILQLGYPGGPLIDKLAMQGNPRAIDFPVALLEKDSLDFSFSGIKTSVLYYVNGHKGKERDASALSPAEKADVAASFQRAAATMIARKLERAVTRFDAKSIIVGGGVSANSAIRARVAELGVKLGIPVFVPPMEFCTDNAAMIAGLGHQLLAAGKVTDLDLEAVATS
jgi:N6-L-threonylcarbamoyladenine synthase